jgi:dihydroxyacetone kinase-like protein
LGKLSNPTPAGAFHAVAEAFGDEVGASSGVLYEEGFAAAALAIGAQRELNTGQQWADVLEAFAAAIQPTGRAEVGDRTMYDAWQPAAAADATAAIEGEGPAVVLKRAQEAVWAGVAGAKNLIPKRGRASLLGERARGFPDTWAASSSIILQSLFESVSASSGVVRGT